MNGNAGADNLLRELVEGSLLGVGMHCLSSAPSLRSLRLCGECISSYYHK
jgi:hypothetical protein